MNQTIRRLPLAFRTALSDEPGFFSPLVSGPLSIEKNLMNIPGCDNARLPCDQAGTAWQPVNLV
jgi:hypothetical protein